MFTALFASLSPTFRCRVALQLEILALRHQIGILQRSVERVLRSNYVTRYAASFPSRYS
jgi:hypothetical protein